MKRILILDISCGEGIYENFQNFIKKSGLSQEVEITLWEKSGHLHLPKNYDLYLLCYHNTSEAALCELKENQPWSKIVLLDGLQLKREGLVDAVYFLIGRRDYPDCLSLIDINVPKKVD